jgi:hypothetical protein
MSVMTINQLNNTIIHIAFGGKMRGLADAQSQFQTFAEKLSIQVQNHRQSRFDQAAAG